IRVVGSRIVLDLILYELEARQSHAIERLVIGAAGVRNRNRPQGVAFGCTDKILERGKPRPEYRANLVIALKIDPANLAGAVVQIEVAGEFLVFGFHLELRRRLRLSRRT